MMALPAIARALGGDVATNEVLAPGPGHSANDRSLSVTLSAQARDGFVVHSFAGDDALICRDYVREKLGIEPFKPNGAKAALRTIHYDYRDPVTGEVRYRKTRLEYPDGTKTFFIDQKGRGGSPPLLYGGERLADLGGAQTVWIVEGEKCVERLRELGEIAVSGDTGESSKWLPEHVELLRGLPVVIWPDSDAPGEKYAARAAAAIRAVDPGADIRVLRPFPFGGKGKDVADWRGDAEAFAALVASAQPYEPIQEQARVESDGEPLPIAPFPRIINPADWEGVPVPEREWIVDGYIPHKTITLLSGDGGQGKSLLALQLAAAMALARDWIGLLPERGRTLVLSAEDDGDEMQRRLDKIRAFHRASWPDLADIRLVDLVGENSVLGAPIKGHIEPTEMYRTLDAYMADFKSGLTALDVLADMFAGQENDRAQVRQFIRLLKTARSKA